MFAATALRDDGWSLSRHIQDVFEVDSVEQVRRQQEMFKQLLGDEVPATENAKTALA